MALPVVVVRNGEPFLTGKGAPSSPRPLPPPRTLCVPEASVTHMKLDRPALPIATGFFLVWLGVLTLVGAANAPLLSAFTSLAGDRWVSFLYPAYGLRISPDASVDCFQTGPMRLGEHSAVGVRHEPQCNRVHQPLIVGVRRLTPTYALSVTHSMFSRQTIRNGALIGGTAALVPPYLLWLDFKSSGDFRLDPAEEE
jgi:hypothetical protein